jgi:hypothetical protein
MKACDIGLRLLRGIAFVFAIGAVIGGVELVFRLLAGHGLPRWSPLTYIGVTLALGFIYIVAEVLWHPIGRVLVEPDKVSDPLWKRSMRLLAIFAILVVVLVGGILAEQHGWLPLWLR